jgi:heme exporter protein D
MSWGSLADFVAMGGYGLYVWGSYAMVVAVGAWEALLLVQRRRRALDELR